MIHNKQFSDLSPNEKWEEYEEDALRIDPGSALLANPDPLAAVLLLIGRRSDQGNHYCLPNI